MTIILEDDGDQKKGEINKLSGWLSVSENNDNFRKVSTDGITWKIKAVTFCAKTKQLFISSFSGDEQDLFPVSPLKSPCLDNNGVSSKSESPCSSRTSRPRLDTQSGFKQFFSRKLAISRSRSVGKMGTQKSDSASPKSPNAFWASWRSQETENTCLEDEAAETSINLIDPNLSVIRPIHPSVLSRPYCFQVYTPLEMKYFCCCNEEEYYTWLRGLNAIVQYDRDQKVRLDTSLSIWIYEAKGIPVRKKYFCEILLDKVLFSRTTAKCKTEMLFWGEQFSFEDLPPTESVTISLFRESDTKKKRKSDKNVFVGSSVIDLVNLETNTEIEKWVLIHMPGISPKLQQKASVSSKAEQPSIRTKLKYETNVVLPIATYEKLHRYINYNYLILTSTLEASISLKTKDLLAHTLLKVLLVTNKAEAFLIDIIMNEVQNTADENLTFRGNSLATKSIDTYMKLIGRNYIQETLGSFITSVYELEDDAEVDPQKLTSNSTCLSDNQKCLIKLVEDAWRSIFLSVQIFPKNLQLVFSTVRNRCQTLNRDIVKKIVSASLFLRLLCPAILSPSLFLLTPEYPSEKVARTLTLVAKTIQNLANFTRFGSKEGYMEILNDFVEREIGNMDNFLQSVSYEPDFIDDSERNSEIPPECLSIDLARELSVMHYVLSSELAKLPLESASKLNDLKLILNEIQLVYDSSPKAEELRMCIPFASAALVCSKPLITPTSSQRDDTPISTCGEATPSSTMDDSECDQDTLGCYLDTSLSFSEDHVPNLSPVISISETVTEDTISLPSRPSEVLAKNTFVHSTSDVTLKNNHYKCSTPDDLESARSRVLPKKENSEKPAPSDPQDKQNGDGVSITNTKKRNNSIDGSSRRVVRESGTVKDRISMFSKKNENIPLKREGKINKPPLRSLPQVAKQPEHSSHLRNSFLETVPERVSTKVKSPPIPVPKPGSKPANKKHLKTNNNDKVLSRQLSIDDDQDNDYCSKSDNIREVKGDEFADRSNLKLHSLQKEHYFVDETSFSDNCQCDKMIEQNKKIGPIDDKVVFGKAMQHKNGKRYVSSCEPMPLHVTNDILRRKPGIEYGIQRRYSEMTASESERKNFNRSTMVVGESCDITQIHSNGYCEILHEGTVERNFSFTSSCSSNCTYSSESYYSDDDSVIYTSGDRLSDALLQESHMCEASKFPSSSDQRQTNASIMYAGRKDTSDQPQSNWYNCEDDVDMLRLQLRETEILLQKARKDLKSRSENFEETVIRLKDKLIEADKKMKAQRAENERQMKNVISRLLNVEGELRNEHAEMEAVIKGKQKMIEVQEKRIKALEGSNIRLLRVLSNMKRNRSRQDEKDIDELLESMNGSCKMESETNGDSLEVDGKDVKRV